jgi:hypothetical protein
MGTVKRGIKAMLHSYHETLQEKKKKSKQLMLNSFLMFSEPRTWLSSAK